MGFYKRKHWDGKNVSCIQTPKPIPFRKWLCNKKDHMYLFIFTIIHLHRGFTNEKWPEQYITRTHHNTKWTSRYNTPVFKSYNKTLGSGYLQVGHKQWFMSTLYCRGCLNNPIFSNLGLCAACWTHFMCHHELWPTSLGHPFSFFQFILRPYWGKTLPENQHSLFLDLFFKILLSQFYFIYILFHRYIFFLTSSGWFVIAVWLYFSQGTR